MDPSAILILTLAATMVLLLIAISYKTGYVSFSIWSLARKDHPKFEIDKTKVNKFVGISALIFVINFLYCSLILQSIREIEGILIFSLWNTVVISYGLSFWMLLKKK